MKFFVPVYTVAGAPWDTALVGVTDDDLAMINRVAKVVRGAEHVSTSRVDMLDFFVWGAVFESDTPEEVVVAVENHVSRVVRATTVDSLARVSSCELVINGDSVWWEFSVKHMDNRFATEPVTIEFLVQEVPVEMSA